MAMLLVRVTAVATQVEKRVIPVYAGPVRSFLPLEDLLNGEDLVVPAATKLLGAFNDAA